MARREDSYLSLMIGGDFLREAELVELTEVVKLSEEFMGRGLLCSYRGPQEAFRGQMPVKNAGWAPL